MSLLKKLFIAPVKSISQKPTPQNEEQAVIIYFIYQKPDLTALHKIEAQFEASLNDSLIGEYDGHEIRTDLNDGILYFYGPSAENLFKVILPILRTIDFMKGARIVLRYGPPENRVKEKTFFFE